MPTASTSSGDVATTTAALGKQQNSGMISGSRATARAGRVESRCAACKSTTYVALRDLSLRSPSPQKRNEQPSNAARSPRHVYADATVEGTYNDNLKLRRAVGGARKAMDASLEEQTRMEDARGEFEKAQSSYDEACQELAAARQETDDAADALSALEQELGSLRAVHEQLYEEASWIDQYTSTAELELLKLKKELSSVECVADRLASAEQSTMDAEKQRVEADSRLRIRRAEVEEATRELQVALEAAGVLQEANAALAEDVDANEVVQVELGAEARGRLRKIDELRAKSGAAADSSVLKFLTEATGLLSNMERRDSVQQPAVGYSALKSGHKPGNPSPRKAPTPFHSGDISHEHAY